MPLIGIQIIFLCLGCAFWWVTARGTHKAAIVALALIGVFAGLALILESRLTELTIKGVGTIKAATEQATADANTIAKIKERIENQSATVDAIASQAAKATELSRTFAEQIRLGEQKLRDVDLALHEAREALAKTKEESDFMRIVVAAQNDDRHAFDKLDAIARDTGSPFAEHAHQAWITIFEAHNKPFFSTNLGNPWRPGFAHAQLWMNELTDQYKTAVPEIRPALIEYIWNREDIKKIEKLDFLVEVMQSDSSLAAVEYAGRFFTTATNQKIKPLALDHLTKWWKDHRFEFE
ncbi:methyl-accepting chemotaxis domain-containing protein [Methylocystis suflitae]|uniref:hypothetical protein n=1 Tax=Methylocystis suflitae TaxID=2951405 RepID=UPI002108B31B|nr:hypothetical protein [Methylocystis suflitae]MCQ4189918.1 hypothetical protein [Methylocystis suflitae]